ncbi:hypothetical protein P8452_43131 [Trifolium repens]|nr:hypothetical protein P8452_43131 [Trifolium repens]
MYCLYWFIRTVCTVIKTGFGTICTVLLELVCTSIGTAGWEGTAHDARVFDQALTNANLNFPHPPPGMYYLVDAGYPTPMGCLPVLFLQSDMVLLLLLINVAAAKQPLETKALPLKDASALEMVNSSKNQNLS